MVLATEMSGKEPGQPGFLGALQDATTSLLNNLSPEDLEEYAQEARDWTTKSPPPHIQSRCVDTPYNISCLSHPFPFDI
jgi:hypothetical protein